jgi:hypothetical protein
MMTRIPQKVRKKVNARFATLRFSGRAEGFLST